LLIAAPARTVDSLAPETDKILRAMSAYLGGLQALSVYADIDIEIVDLEGQKLQLSSYATLALERPARLVIHRRGAFADTALLYNGRVLTLYGKNLNIYKQIEKPGTIDDALGALQMEIGIDAPGADLFFSDPYAVLAPGVVSDTYLGTAYVNGIECHHLAFRNARTDWQLWVQAGPSPLPMKYVITTKWMTGAPQYSVRFRSWDTAPNFKAGQFEFSAPAGAKQIESIQVNEVGEIVIEEVQP